jgi:hypothetical protein
LRARMALSRGGVVQRWTGLVTLQSLSFSLALPPSSTLSANARQVGELMIL